MNKYEWRKIDKDIYLPNREPRLLEIKEMKYITIEGVGDPNKEEFTKNIQALYSMAYGLKMILKKPSVPNWYYEYTIFPLEGIWDLTKEGRLLKRLDKNELIYKLMIRQPDFITQERFDTIKKILVKNKPALNIENIKFEEINEGKVVQILHIGSFDDEQRSFNILNEYINKNNLVKRKLIHKEIYLSDFRRVSSENLKTVLRYYVK
ncbi:MAG: GyrI-like domain-containing protein [Mycoplasma sp.]